jgi:hypothetical protein
MTTTPILYALSPKGRPHEADAVERAFIITPQSKDAGVRGRLGLSEGARTVNDGVSWPTGVVGQGCLECKVKERARLEAEVLRTSSAIGSTAKCGAHRGREQLVAWPLADDRG